MQFAIRFFGIVGLILCIIPFQFKKHKHIVLCKMVSEISFAVQMFLLGGYTGALVDVQGGLVNVVAIDGFRMAIRKEYLEKSSDFKAIIQQKH